MFSKHLIGNKKKEIKGKEKYVEENKISKLDIGGENFQSFETQIDEQACNVSYTLYKPNIKKRIFFLCMQKCYIKKFLHTRNNKYLSMCG